MNNEHGAEQGYNIPSEHLGNTTETPERFGFISPDPVSELCGYHAPTAIQQKNIDAVRLATANLLETLIKFCPCNADRSEAVRYVRNAMMTANASILIPLVHL